MQRPAPRPPEPPPAAPARQARHAGPVAPSPQVAVHDAGGGVLRRLRSSMALVGLVAVVGLMVAVSLGGLLTALAIALRAAVE